MDLARYNILTMIRNQKTSRVIQEWWFQDRSPRYFIAHQGHSLTWMNNLHLHLYSLQNYL